VNERMDTPLLNCGHARPKGNAAGYAVERSTGRKLCYVCAADIDRKFVEDPNNTVVTLYVSSDGAFITTWSNIGIMAVTGLRPRKRPWGTYSVWATDHMGYHWYGVGSGPGMSINLRRTKQTPYSLFPIQEVERG
jgi:hypothetical protein